MPSRVRAGRGGKRNRTPISEVVHILWNQQKLAQGQDRVAEAAEAQHESTAPTDDIETAPASFLGIPELDMPSPFFTFSTARLENLKFALPELNESAVQIGSSGPASPSSQSTLSPASSATDSSSMETPLTCSCDGHPGRLLLDTVYSADGNEVAAAIFGEGGSDVFEDVAVKRGCTDMEIDLWTRDEGGRWDTRVVSYKLYVKGSLYGPMLTDCIERQHVIQHEPTVLVVDVRTEMPSVPYGSVYSTIHRVCISPAGAGISGTRVRIHASVEFARNLTLQASVEKAAMDYLVSYIGYLDECLRELSLHSDSLTYDAQHYPTDILPDDLLSSDGSRPSSSSGSSGASARRSSADSNELRRSTSATAMKTPTVAYHSIPPKKDVTSEIADRKRSIHDSSPARQSAPPPAFACVRKRLHGPRPNIAPQGPYPTPPPLTSSSSGYFGSLPQHPKCHEMKKPLGPRAWSGWEAFQNAVDRSGAAVRNRERASAEPGPVAVVWNGVEWIDAPPALARSLAAQCKASGCAPEKILRRQGGAVAVWMNGQYVVSEGSDAIKIRAPVIPKHWLAPDETGSQSTQRDSGNALAEESEQTDESADGLNFRATTPEDAARWRQAAQLRLQRELAKKQETKANERVRFAENPIVVENSGDESTGASDNQSETELYEYAYSEGSSSAIFGEKTVHAPPVIHVQPPTVEGTPEDTPPVMETPPNESKLKAHVIAEGAAGESGSGHILPVQQQSLTVFLAPPSSTASTALQASMSTVPEISEETRMPDHPSSATPQSVPIPIVVMVMPLLASGVAIRTIGLFGVVRGLWHILVHLAYWLYLACRLLLGYRWPSGTPSPVVPQQAIVLPPQAFLSPACGQAPGTSDESILDSHTIIVTCLSLGALGWILREMLLRSSRTAGGIKTS